MKLIFIEAIPYFVIFTLNIAFIRKILKSSEFRKSFRPTAARPKKALNACISTSDDQVS